MEGAEPSAHFRDLLQRLANEHEREVRVLREELARLRAGAPHSEVNLSTEVTRPLKYREEPLDETQHHHPHSEATWLPLCGCREDTVAYEDRRHEVRAGLHGMQDISESGDSPSDMPVLVLEPGLSGNAGWHENRSTSAAPKSSSIDGKLLWSKSTRRAIKERAPQRGATRERLPSGASAWRTSGDGGLSPEWKDSAAATMEVREDELDEAKERELAVIGCASEQPSMFATGDATPLECWRMFLSYARGHATVKVCWTEVVSNWQKNPQVGNSLQLGNMLTILVPRRSLDKATLKIDSEPRRQFWHPSSLVQVLVSHPNSKRRMMWDMVGVLLLMHDLFMLPMGVFTEGTTGLGEAYKRFLRVYDVSSASFWTVDMGVSILTGYFTNEGFVELRLLRVMKHYIRTWFPLDLLIVSIDWIDVVFSGLGTTSYFLRLGKAISRFMRVLRLLRFMKLNTTMRDMLALINSEYILTLVSLMKILLFMVIMNHYLACVWYYLSTSLQSRYLTWTEATFGVDSEVRMAYAYSTALHWSLTQFTPASMEVFPENEYERFFNIVVIIFALVIFSSFVSGITQAMTHIRNINSARMAREGEIRIFLSSNKISHKLASRIWRSVRQNNTATMGQRRMKGDDIPLLRMLPEPVKEELRQEVYMPILSGHPLFREYFNFDPDAVSLLCSSAVGEASLRAGEDGVLDWKAVKEMIFVVDGTLEYHAETEEEPYVVNKGEWICEPALWAVRASLDGPLVAGPTGCEIMKIGAAELQRVAEAHAGSADFLGRYAKVFIHRFNNALFDDDSRTLFNDISVAQSMVFEVLKQCGKARGLTAFRTTTVESRPATPQMLS